MKRAISISLVFLMLATSMQPSLAFHFCGGSFHSVGIGEAGRGSCCGGRMEAEWLAGALPRGMTVVSTPAEPCCSDYMLELSTDTYHKPFVAMAPAAGCPELFLPLPCLPPSMADVCPRPAFCLPRPFSPSPPFLYTADRLSLICILRI